MSTPVVMVPSITPVREAARHMDYAGVGSLIVIDDDRMVGIVTDRDLALRVLAGDLTGRVPVRQVMSADPVSVAANNDIEAAFTAFRRHAFRRLPVVDGDVVVGMITVDDLLLRAHQILGELLGPISGEILEPQRTAPPPTGLA